MSLIGKRVVNQASEPPAFLILDLYSPAATMAADNGTTNYGKVRAGTLMGKDGNDKVRPCARTTATNTEGGGATEIEVTDAKNFTVGDALIINGSDSGETVAAADPDSTPQTVTASGNVTWSSGQTIAGRTAAGDSSDTPVGILMEDTTTWDSDVDGDGNAVHRDRSCNLLKIGAVEQANVTGDAAEQKSDLPSIIFE